MSVSLPATLRETLQRVGYAPDHIDSGLVVRGGGQCVVAYACLPLTARNSCVVAIDGAIPAAIDEALVETGAPLALVVDGGAVTIFRGTSGGATKVGAWPMHALEQPPPEMRRLLDPITVHRAKTLGPFDSSYQLSFVDVGLLARVEQAQGKDLQRLLEIIVAKLRTPEDRLTDEQAHQVLTIAFWILAARMLKDHGVPGFARLKGDTALEAVARHYAGVVPSLARHRQWKPRVEAAFEAAKNHALNLSKIGPEAIAYVYESSLVAEQTRQDLGTHSTPPFVVEYVLGRLRKWIQAIPPDERIVIEPACGHGAFLVGALQILAEDGPQDARKRHEYLRSRLRGLDIDLVAKEMARLSLTLADVPNPNGWDLQTANMFEGDTLAELARGGTILLANPPFEDFDPKERARLYKADDAVLSNKAAEMLRRVLPVLSPRAVIGLIVPRQFLSSEGDGDLRRALLERYELLEVCTLPDKVFQRADAECAIVLARGASGGTKRHSRVTCRRVREAGLDAFRASATVSTDDIVLGSFFLDSVDSSLAVPELQRLWNSRQWSELDEIAAVQQGLSYLGSVRKGGGETVRKSAAKGFERGIASPGKAAGALITGAPPYNYMSTRSEDIQDKRGGLPTHKPQVVINTHPHGRGPWRLRAFMDRLGAAVPSTRIAIRPRSPATTVEVLWAICNSPVANAFTYANFGKRDITTGVLKTLPIPPLSPAFCADVTRRVRQLIDASSHVPLNEPRVREHLERIDAVVLGAYGLFAPAEQRLLALFDGEPRPALPFDVASVGRKSLLPQYLETSDLSVDLTPAVLAPELCFGPDIDAEIEDGESELAAILSIASSWDSRVRAREVFVRETIQALQKKRADVAHSDRSTGRESENNSLPSAELDAPPWLEDVYGLVTKDDPDAAIDILFHHVDESLGDERASEALFRAVDVKRLDTNLLVGLLSITLPVAKTYRGRRALVERVEDRLREIAPTRADRLLSGLR